MESNGAASNQLNPQAPEFCSPQNQQNPQFHYQMTSSQTFLTEMIDLHSTRVDSLWMPVHLTTYIDPAGQMYYYSCCLLDRNYLMQLALQARQLGLTQTPNEEPTLDQNNVFSEIQFFDYQGLSEEERSRIQEILANGKSQESR